MRNLLLLILVLICFDDAFAQSKKYSVSNAHSHNDYEQKEALTLALSKGFGSIEADVFLQEDSLFVAHYSHEIKRGRTLEKLYLNPLAEEAKKYKGYAYANKAPLQLLIDLKTDAEPTLTKLIQILDPYSAMLYPKGGIQIVITGNRPEPADYGNFPKYIYFDGRPENDYTKQELKRVGLVSQSFRNYSKWMGLGEINQEDKVVLQEVVNQVHKKGKKIRFWADPDTPETWELMKKLGVDYINTDKISELSSYLK